MTVATLYASDGPIAEELTANPCVRVVTLGKEGRWDLAAFGRRLIGLVREVQPHLVHGYMLPANELALLAGRIVGARVVWGIRMSDQDAAAYSRFRRTVQRAGAKLARWPDLIIANSFAGRAAHVAQGYPPGRFVVIPNGITTRPLSPRRRCGTAVACLDGLHR